MNEKSNQPNQEFQSNGKFDLGQFNTAFDKSKQYVKNQTKINSQARLNTLALNDSNKLNNNFDIFDSRYLLKLFIEIKNSWFYIIDDLLQLNFNIETFTKDNRLLYVGITIVMFAVILMIASQFTDDEIINGNNSINSNKIIERYYIYQPIQSIQSIQPNPSISDQKMF